MKLWGFIFLLFLIPQTLLGQNKDLYSARIETQDIQRFWDAMDKIEPQATLQDSIQVLFNQYYLNASPGLVEFIKMRVGSVYSLVDMINKHQKYYASIRTSTLRAAAYDEEIRKGYKTLDSLYGGAVFPDTYIQIGRMNSGGTFTDRYLLIGAEMFGKTSDMPVDELSDWHQSVLQPIDKIPLVVIHELMHYQQKYPEDKTLLAQAITEGSADFLSELIIGDHANSYIHDWANPREKQLWEEFQSRMAGNDYKGWLYGGTNTTERPTDLGYWMGYKIVSAYYNKAMDKKKAIKEIFEIDSFEDFLEQSGYATSVKDDSF